MAVKVKIGSNDYSGQTANIVFYPETGGTINVGQQVIPYDYVTDYFYGTYELNFIADQYTCNFTISSTQPLPVYIPPTPKPITYILDGTYKQDPENFPTNDFVGTTFEGLQTNILLEKYFAGTFDGGISQFRMYVEPLSAPEVKHNFKLLKDRFDMFNPDCPDCGTVVCVIEGPTYIIITPTITPTKTLTPTFTKTPRPTQNPTQTPIETIPATQTPTPTLCPTGTPDVTPTQTKTPPVTKTNRPTKTPTPTQTDTPSVTKTPTKTQTVTKTPTRTNTTTPTPTSAGITVYSSQTLCNVTNNISLNGPSIYYYEIDLGSDVGFVTLTFNATNVPDKFIVEWDGNTVIDTGFRGNPSFNTQLNDLGYPSVTGTGTGSITFNKTLSSPSTAVLVIESPIIGAIYNFTVGCPLPYVTTTPTNTPTKTNAPTITPTKTETKTPTVTKTQTITKTPTKTNTPTVTDTPNSTKTPTPTKTSTQTNTITKTNTPTNTKTQTNTKTNTASKTPTKTPTKTNTPTPTPTFYPPEIKLFSGCCNPYYTFRVFSIPFSVSTGLTYDTTYYLETNGFSGCVTYLSAITNYNFTYSYSNITAQIDCIDCTSTYICPTPPPTVTPTKTPTKTSTQTKTPTQTPTQTRTETPTQTPTKTLTKTPTQTPTVTITNTQTITQTKTNTITPTVTKTNTITPTITKTETPTTTVTKTVQPTKTSTRTQTPTNTPTKTTTKTQTITPTVTKTQTPTSTLTQTPNPSPTNTPTRSVTPSVTKTNTPTRSVTPTVTNTMTVTPTQSLGGLVQQCSVLYTSGRFVYVYNPQNNLSTPLSVPGYNPATQAYSDIAHTTTKLWMTRFQGEGFDEWDISIGNFTATYRQFIPTPQNFYPGAGLCAIDNNRLITSNILVFPNPIVELLIVGGTAIPTTKFNLPEGRIVSGDLLLTVDNKLFVTTEDSVLGNTYLSQYNYGTGQLIFEIPINTITQPFGLFNYNSQLYIANGDPSGKLYTVSLQPPYTTTFIVTIGRQVFGASQIPECVDIVVNPQGVTPTPTKTKTPTNTPTPTVTSTPLQPEFAVFIECCDPYRKFRLYNVPTLVLDGLVSDVVYYVEAVGFTGCATYSPFLSTYDYNYEYINISTP